ncbi:hypothetical protein ABK040_008467 [Willaertia magna]
MISQQVTLFYIVLLFIIDLIAGQELTGTIIYPNNKEYNIDRLDWNQRVEQKFPSAIVYCNNYQDVINAIRYVNEQRKLNNSYNFTIRSGKHSYESYSVTNNGIVIDVSPLTFKKFNTLNDSVISITAGAGNRNFDMYKYLWYNGRYAFPSGTCPTVGISGFTLGGGMGFIARNYGLGIDNLLSVEMVLGNGQLVQVNATNQYSDLFWAIRGGGNGNFGVIVSLTYKLIKAPPFVTKFTLSWKNYNQIFNALDIWQNFATTTDKRLTSQFTIYNGTYGVDGLFLGSEQELKNIISPLFQINSNYLTISMQTFSYFDGVLEYAQCKDEKDCDEQMLKHPDPNQPILYKTKTSYAFKKLTKEAIEVFMKILTGPQPATVGVFTCVQFDSYGGKISEVKSSETAFPHRNALFHAQYMMYYGKREDSQKVEDWMNNWYEKTQPYLSPFAYVNYCDSYLKDYEYAYYGENLSQLRKIKQKYDPNNLFRYEQSIKLI